MKKPPRIKLPESDQHRSSHRDQDTCHARDGNRQPQGPGRQYRSARHHSYIHGELRRRARCFLRRLDSGIAANPYIAFFMKVPGPGTLTLTWLDDSGTTTVEKVPITVA